MKFLATILTSDDLEKLERAIKSVEGVDTLVVANSLDASYAQKAKEVADKYDCMFIETESNGTPGRGKQSVLDYFNTTQYDYLIPIDGDDYLTVGGVDKIIQHVKKTNCDLLTDIGNAMEDGKNVVEHLFKVDMFKSKDWSVSEMKSWMRVAKAYDKFNMPSKMMRYLCLSKKCASSFKYRDDLAGSEDILSACEIYQNKNLKLETTTEQIYIYDFDNGGAFWNYYSNQNEMEKTAAALEELYERKVAV